MTQSTIDHVAATSTAVSTVGAILGWLPVVLSIVATSLAIAWYCIRIYDYYKHKRPIE